MHQFCFKFKKSKVLISLDISLVIETFKKFDFEIYYFDINDSFEIVSKNTDGHKFDLFVMTHPFDLYKFWVLKDCLSNDCKVILDVILKELEQIIMKSSNLQTFHL